MNIAIIGAGISGNLAARLLATKHQITLFEAGDYAGGHTNTVEVQTTDGPVSVDTGFMVFNRRTYPNFCRMLELLGVESHASDMSFSVHDEQTGLEYCGSSLNTLFAQRRNLLRPAFHRMVRDILRFNKAATQFVRGAQSEAQTLGNFLRVHQLGCEFRDWYLIPMLAAIWSAAPAEVEALPAKFILGFMQNHGLLQIRDRPQWRTIVGGAKNYVARLLEPIADRVRLSTPVAEVRRRFDGVVVQPTLGPAEEFDAVVFASHADQSLSMLSDATNAEQEILTAFPYQPNVAVLHSDPSPMPTRRLAWASWNYRVPVGDCRAASVTYDLVRLQNLKTTQPVFVTLNPVGPIDPAKVHRTFEYHHPAYSLASSAAQSRWHEISGHNRTWYCGAFWGYGFHEDGVRSALAVAEQFGIDLEALVLPPHTGSAHSSSSIAHAS
ncbi:NAD(P)/FAD-dependent oxidoreductase [Aeoliella sp. SH292]|uniref:NAD(P)/FAD-dependent oxidoreductase n=1 Tax=Aeoliella sp. SH292 TaxID=3454464 RepID=UPI003F9551E0